MAYGGLEMVLTDIRIPALGKQYSFQLNEQEAVKNIIEELTGIVCQKEQCRLEGPVEELSLWSEEQRRRLPKEASLMQCGIMAGSSLILV